ncbi:PA2169 family four-helix-bundle protein [Novosphingobium aquae]|uniref:PA2169 family four-helix-bundle protein n=1 Tax=Novosphingobium aquae TaxID=3133435 RepID=A0ABU8SEJ6_9SPHN
MTQHNETTTTLNTLIATLIDSVEGYQKSAGDVDNPRYADLFNARARERQQAITGLQAAVAAAGGNPEDDGSVMGTVHRAFQSLREVVSTRDDAAIIAEIERGEDYLKEKFEAALRHADLSPEARDAVNKAWDSVKAGHDEMSALKHGTERHSPAGSSYTN